MDFRAVNPGHPLRLFEAFGIELEYMIVDAERLDPRPVADRILGPEGDLDRDRAVWSNELALHVFEIKVAEPAPTLAGLADLFQGEVEEVSRRLVSHRARLLPTGMHPWMDPTRDFRRWPHHYDEVYAAFDRIFDCRGHGWSNLQSVHLNLPFADDAEFARLHAAVRLVLPLLPGLAASTPFRDGAGTGLLDTRLEVYRHNADRVPSVVGSVIPEPVATRADYEREILERIYRDLAPLDPEGILRHEWVNARGAIARFDRNSLEIRLLDMQECPRADLAVAAATVAGVRALAEARWAPLPEPRAFPPERLLPHLEAGIRDGEAARIEDAEYLRLFGLAASGAAGQEIWERIFEEAAAGDAEVGEWTEAWDLYLREGCLARRIRNAVGHPTPEGLRSVYGDLADCLAEGRLFAGDGGTDPLVPPSSRR